MCRQSKNWTYCFDSLTVTCDPSAISAKLSEILISTDTSVCVFRGALRSQRGKSLPISKRFRQDLGKNMRFLNSKRQSAKQWMSITCLLEATTSQVEVSRSLKWT